MTRTVLDTRRRVAGGERQGQSGRLFGQHARHGRGVVRFCLGACGFRQALDITCSIDDKMRVPQLAELLKPYCGGKCPVQINYRNLIGSAPPAARRMAGHLAGRIARRIACDVWCAERAGRLRITLLFALLMPDIPLVCATVQTVSDLPCYSCGPMGLSGSLRFSIRENVKSFFPPEV